MRLFAITVFVVFLFGACSSTPPKTESFSVDLNSPRYEAGTTEVYFEPYLSVGNVKKNENVGVYYYPVEDAVCLHFKINFADCNQFWDKAGREAFVRAFTQYKEDYEQRKLSKGSKRTTGRAYGSTPGYFAWRKTVMGVQAHGFPRVDFGYLIEGQSAFFSTAQTESDYIDPIARSRNQTSPVVRMYFTRAQAEGLIALFDDAFLRSLYLAQSGGSPAPDTTAADFYTDEGL